jgi:hypothetical protein
MRQHLPRKRQEELEDNARLTRAWRQWHAEQLEEALAGLHGTTVAELTTLLDRLELDSAAVLLDCVQRTDWSAISYSVRLTILHEINSTISRMRERHGMAPIDDPLPDQPDNVFRRIKHMLLGAPAARSASRFEG